MTRQSERSVLQRLPASERRRPPPNATKGAGNEGADLLFPTDDRDARNELRFLDDILIMTSNVPTYELAIAGDDRAVECQLDIAWCT